MGNENYKCSCFRNDISNNEFELHTGQRPRYITPSKMEDNMLSFVTNPNMTADGSTKKVLKNSTNDLSVRTSQASFNQKNYSLPAIIKIQSVYRGFIFRKKLKKYALILSKKELAKLKEKIVEFFNQITHKSTNQNIKFMEPLNVDEGWKKYYDEEDNEISVINESVFQKTLLHCHGYFSNLYKVQSLYIGTMDTTFKYNGNGHLYFLNGAFYEGVFNNGKLNGWGRYTDKLGNCFEGLFENGTLTGKGVEIFPDDTGNKIMYEGDFKKFIKEGYGIETCNEYIYEGNFKDNLKHGQGKLKYNNTSDVYIGEFTNGSITGYGFYTWDNKHSYLGDFVDGKMHGKGVYKWPDGSVYKGDYVDNIKEGMGEFQWKDGRIYKGPFLKGKPHGKGKLIIKDIVIEGNFNAGKFDGNLKEIVQNIRNDANKKNKIN